MQSPFGRPYDEDDDPDDEPRSPLDLRGGYRSRADADDIMPRARDDRPSRTGLPVRPGGAASDKKSGDQGKGGGLGLPFRRKDDDKSSGPSRSPFGVRGDDARDEDTGGRRMPFGRGGSGSDKKSRDKKSSDKKSGKGFGLPLGRGKDDKKSDRPAKPAFGGSLPGRGGDKPGAKDEKKGRLGGLLGKKGKDDKPSRDKGSARPGGLPPRRSSPFDDDDDRPGRGLSGGPSRSGESSFRSPLSGGPSDRSAAQRSPLSGGSDRDRGPFGSPGRSPLSGESGPARRSPFGTSDDDDDALSRPARPAGLGGGRPADRALPGERPAPGAKRNKDEGKRGGLLGGLRRGGQDKAPSAPGPKASRSSSRALPQSTKAPRIVKHGLDLDRKLDLIGVSLVGFALVVFFAVLPSMSFGLLPPVTGGLTGTINHFLSQLFGWGKIVWPIASAIIGLWLMMRYFGGQMFDVDYFRVVGAISLYACALTWLHFFELVNDPAPTVEAFREISHTVAVDQGEGGGWFGHQFYLLLLGQLGDLGAVSVMVAWLVASLMLTFDVSLVELGQFIGAMLAAFNVSPAQRARKREAQATAEADAVGVMRPGETPSGRPRQMPLAPSAATAGADSGARSQPVIRRPGSAESPAPGEPSPATTLAAGTDLKPGAGDSGAEDAPAKSKGLLAGRRLPGLRRSPAKDDTPEGESKPDKAAATGAAAVVAAGAAGLGGKFGRMLRRDQSAEGEPSDDAKRPAGETSAAEKTAAPLASKTSAPADDATTSASSDVPESPRRRLGGLPLPTRDKAAATASDDRKDEAAPAEETAPEIPRRPLPGVRRPDDETPAGGLATRPPQRAERASVVDGAAPDEDDRGDEAAPSNERALPFANPFQRRPTIEPRDVKADAPADEEDADDDTPDTPAAATSDLTPSARPEREETPPRRRSLPFRDEPAATERSAPSDEPPDERSLLGRSGPHDPRPAESASVRSFLDGINLPQRPKDNANDAGDDDPAQEKTERADAASERPSRSTGAGAALAGAAMLGASALGRKDKPDTDASDDGETLERLARPVAPPQRPSAAQRFDEDDEDDDLDLLDEDDDLNDEGDEDEPLFDTPARPVGLVRPPQRPGAGQPRRPEPQPSDAGVRAANEFTERAVREDPEQTRPSDDFTRRAPIPRDAEPPARPAEGRDRPVTTTHKPKRINYQLPDISKTLKAGKEQRVNDDMLLAKAKVIEDTLSSFGAPGKVVEVNPGPVITQFGVEPDYLVSRSGKRTRVKVGSIARLDADLALALAAKSIRIEAPVPGKGFVGIEVPNDDLTVVTLRDVIESPEFKRVDSKLAIALGLGVDGTPVAADLTAMPHLLIAGTTGSGKSVCVNAIIACLLANNTPEDVQFIMVDPKRVELTGYNHIPHLVSDVVVELERIVGVLQAVQREMERRYKLFADTGSRNILDYNRKLSKDQIRMPYLVVVIDELADLMMLAPDETERLLARLAQMARATGIHLIISTQRPSVDIITGLIKANFPARVAFAVASSVDSRVILDQPGAEKLLGRGDMLYQSPDAAAPLRMQGVFVSDDEINAITKHWRQQRNEHGSFVSNMAFHAAPMDGGRSGASLPSSSGNGQPTFWDTPGAMSFNGDDDEGSDQDELYREAVEIVQNLGRASISLLQRRLRIGYTRAARLIDLMEEEGIVGPAESGSKPREVLKYD